MTKVPNATHPALVISNTGQATIAPDSVTVIADGNTSTARANDITIQIPLEQPTIPILEIRETISPLLLSHIKEMDL